MGQGDYEPGTVRIFDQVLEKGDSVIIAGAHQGYFARHCASLAGEVFAFEPEPTNREILTKAVEGLNVEVFPFALGDRNAEAKFYINSDNDGGHALWDVSKHAYNIKTQQERQAIKVEIKTIDSIDLDFSNLKLLMLDAEGAEHSILKGAINTIVDYDVPYIICEINNYALKQCQTSQMALRSYLSIYGFQGYIVNDNDVTEAERGELSLTIPGIDMDIVFNMFFSKRGKV